MRAILGFGNTAWFFCPPVTKSDGTEIAMQLEMDNGVGVENKVKTGSEDVSAGEETASDTNKELKAVQTEKWGHVDLDTARRNKAISYKLKKISRFKNGHLPFSRNDITGPVEFARIYVLNFLRWGTGFHQQND